MSPERHLPYTGAHLHPQRTRLRNQGGRLAMPCPLAARKEAWSALSCRRLGIILMSSLLLTWLGTRGLVLSRTGSCFSPLYRSFITGTLVGCRSRVSWTSLCSKVRRSLKVFFDVLARGWQGPTALGGSGSDCGDSDFPYQFSFSNGFKMLVLRVMF